MVLLPGVTHASSRVIPVGMTSEMLAALIFSSSKVIRFIWRNIVCHSLMQWMRNYWMKMLHFKHFSIHWSTTAEEIIRVFSKCFHWICWIQWQKNQNQKEACRIGTHHLLCMWQRWYHCSTETHLIAQIFTKPNSCLSYFSDSLNSPNSVNSVNVLLHLDKSSMCRIISSKTLSLNFSLNMRKCKVSFHIMLH